MVHKNKKGKSHVDDDEEMRDTDDSRPTPPPPALRSTRHLPRIDERLRDAPDLVWYGHPDFPYNEGAYTFGRP